MFSNIYFTSAFYKTGRRVPNLFYKKCHGYDSIYVPFDFLF